MAQKASGSLTITNITDGANANIWTTSTAPTTPNYTFTISNLTGADDNPRVGDIILQGVYRYTITSIGSTTVLAGSRQSLQGATGAAGGKWYSGTGITGTNTTAQVFSGSGVSSAVVGDMYLNTSTDNVYQCTTAGNASTAQWKYVGNIKGSTGSQGRSVTSVVTEYYRKLSGGSAPTSSTTGSTTIPDYVDGCTYYTRTITNFDSGNPDKSEWVANSGLTNEIKNAYDAWIAAGAAELKVAKIIQNSEGMIVTSGINGGDVTPGTTSTYGYNTLMAPNYLGLRYNAINLAKLTTTESTPALEFYIPSVNSGGTPVQGNKGLSISATALTFYNPSSNAAQLIIGANGTLQSGNYTRGSDSKFSSNGTKIDLINGDIITKYFRVSQGLESGLNAGVYVHGTIEALDGTIGTDSTNYWEIGNSIDYNLNSTAKMVGHGSSYIQLGDSSTWRLSTNRIHTAWYTSSDSLLHFPAISSKYWDFGVHTPDSATDKFLYIRSSKSNTSTSSILQNLLYDIDDSYATPQWDYKFYIDGSGNLYAANLYFFDENGNAVQVGGADGAYLPKTGGTITGNLEVNGTLTKGSKNVAYLTATPTTNQVLIADGTTGGIKTSGYTIAKSVPSGALFTDENVKSSEANTTKLWLVGSDTSGTRTGTLKYDSGVYITTTAGTIHATTFEGNLSGTATKANQDGDGNVIKSTYLKLTGGNVTGAVTFGSSISAASASIVDLTVTGSANFTNGLSGNLTGTASRAIADSDGNQINNTYLKKSGGTMTGTVVFSTTNAIGYQGTQANYSMIRFKDNTNDNYGNGIIIGGGGLTVVGGGESADTMAAQYAGGDEVLALGSDGAVYIYTNLQSGWADRKTFTFSTDGVLVATGFSGSGASLTSLNASNISSGTLAAARLPNSGVTAGSYGPSTNAEPGYGSTFNVPYVTVDTYGRVTSISTKTIKIPTSDNTNTWRPVVDNLTSTATDQSLSAAQGKILNESKLSLTGGQVTGPVTFGDSVSIDDLTVGQLIVNGNASFVNGLTTTTVNGYTPAAAMAKGVVTSIDTSANLPTSNAVKTFVENKGYVTSSGVTSVTVAATSPVQSSTGTAQTGSSVSTTISLKDGYGDTKNPYASKTANYVLAAPNGSNGAPSFRALVAADIPNLNWSKITAGKPTTASGYGITDALVDAAAESVSGGSTTFTFTKSNGDPLSFDVVVYASAATQATDANYLTDGTSRYSVGGIKNPIYFENGIPKASNGTEGTSTKPVYLSSGTLTAGSTYAGGTAVTLNGTNKGASTASFYAPTSYGSSSQVLIGGGQNATPTWTNISSLIPSNAGTADAFSSAATIALTGDTTGSASSTKGWSITTKTDRISTVGDNRAVATTPNDYVNKIIFQGLKTNSSFGSPSTDSYSYVVGLRGWSDSSGGNSHEFAFNNSGINHRSGATTSWGAWEKLVTSSNYTDYTVTKTGSGASGTWAINISGNAAKDGDGNVIKTTYLKLTGGNVTGNTTFGSSVSINSLSVVDMTCTGSASFTNGLSGNLTGNASTATAFSSNASITLTGDTTGTANSTKGWSIATTTNKVNVLLCNSNTNSGLWSSIKNGKTNSQTNKAQFYTVYDNGGPYTYGEVLEILSANTNHWQPQLWFDGGKTGQLRHRNKNYNDDTWGDWYILLDNNNYTTYTVKKDGTGASGTWGISITGNAATATKATKDSDDNTITSSYLRRFAWWNSGDTHDIDDLRAGITFAYGGNHNGPTTGTVVAFDCSTSTAYTLQLMGSYNGDDLYFRNRNGDNGTWRNWNKIIHNNNYTSYTVTKTGTGASGTWGISISGNAATATDANKLQYQTTLTTDDNLNGFLEASKFKMALWSSTSSPGVANGIILSGGYSSATYGFQIAIDDDPTYFMALRQRNGSGWASWKRIPMGDGTGASGTWSISISGTAAKATADKNGNDITTKYVTIDTDQTITASQKTFTGATRWGSASKYGATYYDSTLEALVFSFT